MKSFHDLGTERSIGMSLGPIPWSKIVQYADRSGLEPDVAEAFVDIMRTMDVEFMKYNTAEQKRAAELNKPKKAKR